jgi:peptidoglycan/xylan/chitin deacetylase (PgdA/CDA1 family)
MFWRLQMRVDLEAWPTAAAWFAPSAAPVVRSVADAFGIPRTLPRPHGIALTFDDGPHARGTVAVLEILADHGACATFFLVGEQVEREPMLAAEIASAGHEIAIHGYRHTLLLRRSPQAVHDDLLRAHDVIASATGTSPRLYRPPYGVFSGPALLDVRRLGWHPLLWSRWGRDWRARTSADAIARRASHGIHGGDVVLLHDADYYSSEDSWRKTVAALPLVLESVRASGEPFVVPSHST